jgi:hypothetical protein
MEQLHSLRDHLLAIFIGLTSKQFFEFALNIFSKWSYLPAHQMAHGSRSRQSGQITSRRRAPLILVKRLMLVLSRLDSRTLLAIELSKLHVLKMKLMLLPNLAVSYKLTV